MNPVNDLNDHYYYCTEKVIEITQNEIGPSLPYASLVIVYYIITFYIGRDVLNTIYI